MKKSHFDLGGASSNRRDFLKLSLGAGAAAAISGLASPALAQRVRSLRFGNPQPTDSNYHKAMMMFAEEVATLSSNKIKIETFPNSQLGSIKEMLTAVQLGTLSMTNATPAWYSNFVRQMDVFTLPFLISSPDKLRSSFDGAFGAQIEALSEAAGFKILGNWLMGARHMLNNVHPINTPADVAGLKFRVISSQVYLQAFRAMGASPVALDSAEIYLAMQQKVVDGLEYPIPDLINVKLYEVCKYISLTSHVTDFFVVSMNKGLWDGFSSEEQGILQAAMKKSMDWEWQVQPQTTAAATEKLKTLMQINDITPENRALFAKATRPVYQQFEDSIGKDLLDQAIKELS
jgi:tripartite ATP-independent transporter DctP family solute receptor